MFLPLGLPVCEHARALGPRSTPRPALADRVVVSRIIAQGVAREDEECEYRLRSDADPADLELRERLAPRESWHTLEQPPMTSATNTSKETGSVAASEPVIEVIHFADPFCWWSWGLEPILARLKEVYGDQVEVTYRMGGMADKIANWRRTYNVTEDRALRAWISQSSATTEMPVDADFIVKSAAQSSWPACIAVKAAELQDKGLAAELFRKLMESIQLRAADISDEAVYLAAAKEIGLDPDRLRADINSGSAVKLFAQDREEMNVNFMTLVLVNRQTRKAKAVGGTFAPSKYEAVIEELSGGRLGKKTPRDILDYFRRHPDHLVPAKEISAVFGVSVKDAEHRLNVLSEGGLLDKVSLAGGQSFWTAPRGPARELTAEQANAAHVH